MIDFNTSPKQYRHWELEIEGRVAFLKLAVDQDAGLHPGYTLKLNSYDLGVDIELHDAVQRLRFEHPEVGSVVLTSERDRVFCSGANISMLGLSSHGHKVNFCKFTNETRNEIEDASLPSGQVYLSALNGTAAGGGYEMALATEHIMLVDDSSSTVSLPEVPLLAVLPGTGGLTRVVDKRKVRRDHADFFCTVSEGIRGKRALQWKLVDELVPRSRFRETVEERAKEIASKSPWKEGLLGITLNSLERQIEKDEIRYRNLHLKLDRERACVDFHIQGPSLKVPATIEEFHQLGDSFWMLALGRELDDAILHLSFNEPAFGTWVFHTQGDAVKLFEHERFLVKASDDWLAKEITLFLKRVLKRIDLTSRSLITLVEPGSCFAGFLLELVLASDRSYMLDGTFENSDKPAPKLLPTEMNFGPMQMCNGLTRLETRFLDQEEHVAGIESLIGQELDAEEALELGLITFIPDDIDWEDEVRLAIEERSSFSPDALTGMEASLRFPGPETIETKIFGRLSAWQNWIFQRPNAVGEEGALKLYGTGKQARFIKERV